MSAVKRVHCYQTMTDEFQDWEPQKVAVTQCRKKTWAQAASQNANTLWKASSLSDHDYLEGLSLDVWYYESAVIFEWGENLSLQPHSSGSHWEKLSFIWTNRSGRWPILCDFIMPGCLIVFCGEFYITRKIYFAPARHFTVSKAHLFLFEERKDYHEAGLNLGLKLGNASLPQSISKTQELVRCRCQFHVYIYMNKNMYTKRAILNTGAREPGALQFLNHNRKSIML